MKGVYEFVNGRPVPQPIAEDVRAGKIRELNYDEIITQVARESMFAPKRVSTQVASQRLEENVALTPVSEEATVMASVPKERGYFGRMYGKARDKVSDKLTRLKDKVSQGYDIVRDNTKGRLLDWTQSDNPMVRYAGKGAFTLVEMLVVTAIIGVLATMLLPALSKAKDYAYRAKCAAQLQQIGVASYLYADDNDGALPVMANPTGSSVNGFTTGVGAPYFYGLTQPYLKNPGWTLFFDPTSSTYKSPPKPLPNPLWGAYFERGAPQFPTGVEPRLGRVLPNGVSLSDIAILSDYETASPIGSGNWVTTAHKNQGKNVLYMDNHVEWVKVRSDSKYAASGGDSVPGANDGTWGKLDRRRE